ncbi:hypothetical protein CRUP_018676, partial [Coryphaenoides rupestris]
MGMCLFNMPEVKVLYGGQKCGNGYATGSPQGDALLLVGLADAVVAVPVHAVAGVAVGRIGGVLVRRMPDGSQECLNPCCNATTCSLKGEAVCAHGQCCHECQLKLAGTPCRESSHSCDLPEYCTGSHPHCPANVYLHDGHACHSAAPGICFQRVNSAGDPYGNCGKDSKGSFAKCEARDAKCGKIQCQGGATRPVIGTNAVSIETNIPQQEGGRILCRGTHVYLGDDMPDPGLVLTGTKCGDGMECAAKCSGHGVCNNNNNCHCEPHWAPPFCAAAGFGGSVDSGPMRLADSRGVIVGVLVALLTLLGAGVIVCVKRKSLSGLLLASHKNPMEKL